MSIPLLTFPPFTLDLDKTRLQRGRTRLPLSPKDFALLHYLVTHAGRVISHAELLQAVWGDTVVSLEVIKVRIGRLRRLLRDKADSPRFIANVHGQGYRFVAAVTAAPAQQEAWSVERGASPLPPIALRSSLNAPRLVGRDTELAQLHKWLVKAINGERQLVFVTGEPGIGKTFLLEAFGAGVQDQEKSQNSKVKSQKSKGPLPQSPICSPQSAIAGVWLGWGQCIEHYGTGEPYLPVLEALGRLCRAPDGERFKALLGQHAPTWFAQMPALLSPADMEALQRRIVGATRERMLREFAEALEVLTAEQALVLMVEDLHWADVSTLELLSTLARRQEPARVLVLGTYRTTEVLGNGHPLRAIGQELHLHQQCEELALGLLTENNVETYLSRRFPGGATDRSSLRQLARVLHQRTEGNPLFMVSVVDDIVARGGIEMGDGPGVTQVTLEERLHRIPENLQQMIERQCERLSSEEQRLLEVASVAGMEFSTAAVAAVTKAETSQVEQWCEALVRRSLFLSPRSKSPGSERRLAARYGFRHALYYEVLSERLTPARQRQLHQQIGEWKEANYGELAQEIASELAVHFEQGRDYPRAIHYLQQAGEKALRRSAYTEAITHLTKGLELLQTLPDTPGRTPFRGRVLRVRRQGRNGTGMARPGHIDILGSCNRIQDVGGNPCLASVQSINGPRWSLPTCRT